jgi:hypothetical protein
MFPVEVEPTIPASARPQTYALYRAATGIGTSKYAELDFLLSCSWTSEGEEGSPIYGRNLSSQSIITFHPDPLPPLHKHRFITNKHVSSYTRYCRQIDNIRYRFHYNKQAKIQFLTAVRYKYSYYSFTIPFTLKQN